MMAELVRRAYTGVRRRVSGRRMARAADLMVAQIKGRPPVVPHEERMDVIRALDLVDEVISDWSSDKFEMWKQLRYDVLFKGDDWKGTEKGTRLERLLGEVGAQVHYFPYTASTSSTDLRRLLEGMS